MYSLYRAWFGDGTTGENYPRLQESLSPPDTVVRVGNEGEHQFVAHKGVLAAHSGYLKALLASAATTSTNNSSINTCSTLPTTAIAVTATNLVGLSPRQPVTSVSVSSIGGEAFAPLLNYMYTGRLEVTLDNVYSVLLATHLLHMPGALEQCRAALLRLRAAPHLPMPVAGQSTTATPSVTTSAGCSGNILRPIPNRLMMGPSLCWPPPAPLYPGTGPTPGSVGIPHLTQLQPSVLMQPTVPTVSVIPTPGLHEASNSSQYSNIEVPSPKSSPNQHQHIRGSRIDCRSRSPESSSSTSLPFVAAAAAAFTAFSNVTTSTRISSPSESVSPTPSSNSHSPTPLQLSRKGTEQQQRNTEEPEDSNIHSQSYLRSSTEESTSRNRENNKESILLSENERNRQSRRRGRTGSSNGNDNTDNVLSVIYDIACCDGPVRFHRVLNENYSSASLQGSNTTVTPPSRLVRPTLEPEAVSSESDENGEPEKSRGACKSNETVSNNSSGSYTCGYCRHTFKSQYCYRKHAKRHLLPTRVNESNANRPRPEGPRNRREVKLLDLNVQYYPCKICGCKFPSYYFVHKHRKLCHANVDERSQGEATNITSSQEQETSGAQDTQRD